MNKNRADIDFIPPHFNCNNCGECCGPVPISNKEFEEIYKYCTENNINVFKDKHILDCAFRDKVNETCIIYEVRPTICKLFGVSEGMCCCNGNSNNINGYKYISKDMNKSLDNMRNLIKLLSSTNK